MSPKNPLLTAGLTALGLFGFAPLGVADPAPPTPSGSEPSVAPNPSHAVLLLTNGRLYEGTLSDGGSQYYVHTKTGKLPIPKRDVQKLGRSVREIYDYLLQRVPARDPDEHMRLARWCLEQGMNAEAVGQLREVVELSPNHPQALAMLDKLGGTAEREMRRDPDVARANAEVADRDEGLNPALIGQAQRELGISNLPQIPGLTKAMNVKRVGEFARLVEPVLQARCVKCHDERYEGAFQLVRYKSRSDRSADAFRSNLDSVLALIDLENPAKSELLSATLRAHGGGNHPKPIFKGSNDRQYQILATWVSNLRRTPAVIAAQPQPPANNAPRFGTPAPAATTETFAAGRAGQTQTTLPPLSPTPTAPGRFDPAGAGAANIPPPLPPGEFPSGSEPTTMTPENPYPNNVRVTVHSGDKDHPGVAPGTSFPTPFAVSGARPTLEPVPGGGAMIPPPRPATAPATGSPVGAGAGTGVGAGVNPVGAPAGLPALPQDAAAVPPAAERASAAPKKSIKFDPGLLEKALMNRYAPR